ncbi:protein lethal(3)malignant blood neoplasm 1 isoform X2 [Episyrphus balteatus]|uniref:protein lethal(3)malignant blood neoplasm 1 isoform X2 n=1 Tax=Episyrphus balteatus TaxID=286459 RepID=UPI00248652EB|nr:protein lethal(3)malignant blood neoplasm 1 isoform X2 [Episyrphus balteatus]
MFWRLCLILFIGVLLEWKLTHSAPAAENGKTKEKVRAYEFGFSIEEQQHRHEKRDENGIVMGEFGFITADGIYHVTVYATDENGKFKIISMKNYPYGGSPEKKIMIARLPPAKMPVVTTTKQPTTIKSLVPDGSSCGGCVKPKKMNLLPADVKGGKPDDEKAVFRPLSKALSNGKTNGEAVKVGKSTPTSKSVVGGNGKGTTGSKVPGSQPLVPPKVSTPGAQKTNGATSSKNGPGKNDKYGPLINVRLDSNSLTPPKTSTSGANVPTSPSKNGQVPTKNGITQQYQKGSTNTATQNTGRPPFKTAKEPKSFQTLSKALPDEDSSVKNRLPQTSTLTTVPSKTRVLQKPGQSPSLITSRPQLISKNTIKTQPQLTTQTLIPKRLQQNTNEAKTTTTNTQSTNKQTPAVPSKQSTGKTTSSTNPAAGSGGIGGASSSGSAAGGGGGPLYKFNYVLDYNSHREEGRIDGSKEGNYNTIDEDGIRRIIDYIANENGYQPHIKLERLPPNEVPTGENKLKEYEFVWFN